VNVQHACIRRTQSAPLRASRSERSVGLPAKKGRRFRAVGVTLCESLLRDGIDNVTMSKKMASNGLSRPSRGEISSQLKARRESPLAMAMTTIIALNKDHANDEEWETFAFTASHNVSVVYARAHTCARVWLHLKFKYLTNKIRSNYKFIASSAVALVRFVGLGRLWPCPRVCRESSRFAIIPSERADDQARLN
jgi:hypothetical protein